MGTMPVRLGKTLDIITHVGCRFELLEKTSAGKISVSGSMVGGRQVSGKSAHNHRATRVPDFGSGDVGGRTEPATQWHEYRLSVVILALH